VGNLETEHPEISGGCDIGISHLTGELFLVSTYGEVQNTVSVLKFHSGLWENVGNGAFEAVPDPYYPYPEIDFDPEGNPCVAFVNGSEANGISVFKFREGLWSRVGVSGLNFRVKYGEIIGFASNHSTGEIFVAFPDVFYIDDEPTTRGSVMRFDGNGWNYTGPSNFITHPSDGISFAINPFTGEPYVGFSDGANLTKATVMKFTGSSWVPVGSPGFSKESYRNIFLSFNPADSKPYVSLISDDSIKKPIVMRYTEGDGDDSPLTPTGLVVN
jgi:hypothetical protein